MFPKVSPAPPLLSSGSDAIDFRTDTTDSVLGRIDAAPHVLEYARQSDGAMLAHGTLLIRSSLATAVCDAG